MSPPTVSVIIPAYNAEEYLVEAVSSLMRQTLKDIEVIIVDDGSTDSTWDVVRELISMDSRVRGIRSGQNFGIASALNTGIQDARADLIAILDADDKSVPERLLVQSQFLAQHRNVSVVGGWISTFGVAEVGEILECPVGNDLVEHFATGNPMNHSTVMYRSELFRDLNFQYSDSVIPLDYELLARIALRHNVANIPSVLSNYRIHADQHSKINARESSRDAFRIRTAFTLQGALIGRVPPRLINRLIADMNKSLLVKIRGAVARLATGFRF